MARLHLFRVSIAIVTVPLIIASRTTWWLEGIRTQLLTSLALAELEGHE